jgi:hypothetical protein
MSRPRVSIARLMGVVAIVAVDCALVRWADSEGFETRGLLTTGLVLSAGLIGLLVTSGRAWNACFGFAAIYVLALWIVVSATWYRCVSDAHLAYVAWMQRWGPDPLAPPIPRPDRGIEYRGNPWYWIYSDVAISLPELAAALVGGSLCLVIRPSRPPSLASHDST